MAKGTGTKRSVNSGNAASTRSASNWITGTDSRGNNQLSAVGDRAERVYTALNGPVEHAVQEAVGDIRSGGGISVTSRGNEYSIIFRDGATEAQMQKYVKLMDDGAKLYSDVQNSGTREDYDKALETFERWARRIRR